MGRSKAGACDQTFILKLLEDDWRHALSLQHPLICSSQWPRRVRSFTDIDDNNSLTNFTRDRDGEH